MKVAPTARQVRLVSTDPPRAAPGPTPALARIGVSLPGALLAQVDQMVAERGLPGRSQLIAELIRHEVAEVDRDSGEARHALARVQSEFVKEVISSQHVFLEDDQSLEVLLVQGSGERLQQLCDRLRGVRAVQQLRLVTTTSLLPPLHAHGGVEDEDAADLRRASR
jgi:CopG family nickel-responsive transcriptional regulator